MSRQLPGLTKMLSVGPLARSVEEAGGSLARVFQRAGLPLALIDQPERLILLSDQLRLLEAAAWEIGDEALPSRLSVENGVAGLGVYGRKVQSAPTLGEALRMTGDHIELLQSSTLFRLDRLDRRRAFWSYNVLDDSDVGRQKNEVLALGYMLDLLRAYTGRDWTPGQVSVTGASLPAHRRNEDHLGCEVSIRARAGIEIPIEFLELPQPDHFARAALSGNPSSIDVPQDLAALTRQLIYADVAERRPRLSDIARRAGLPIRSFQRELARCGASFEQILQQEIMTAAKDMLAREGRSITDIALTLGYSDPAHFTRAFFASAGMTPIAWRRGLT